MTQEQLDNKLHELNMACNKELAELDSLRNKNKEIQHNIQKQINKKRESIDNLKEEYHRLLALRDDTRRKYEVLKQHLIVANPKTGKNGVMTLKDAYRLRHLLLDIMKEGLADSGIDLNSINVQFFLNGEGIDFHLITTTQNETEEQLNHPKN